jgi:hypothetical protein
MKENSESSQWANSPVGSRVRAILLSGTSPVTAVHFEGRKRPLQELPETKWLGRVY